MHIPSFQGNDPEHTQIFFPCSIGQNCIICSHLIPGEAENYVSCENEKIGTWGNLPLLSHPLCHIQDKRARERRNRDLINAGPPRTPALGVLGRGSALLFLALLASCLCFYCSTCTVIVIVISVPICLNHETSGLPEVTELL